MWQSDLGLPDLLFICRKIFIEQVLLASHCARYVGEAVNYVKLWHIIESLKMLYYYVYNVMGKCIVNE